MTNRACSYPSCKTSCQCEIGLRQGILITRLQISWQNRLGLTCLWMPRCQPHPWHTVGSQSSLDESSLMLRCRISLPDSTSFLIFKCEFFSIEKYGKINCGNIKQNMKGLRSAGRFKSRAQLFSPRIL